MKIRYTNKYKFHTKNIDRINPEHIQDVPVETEN